MSSALALRIARKLRREFRKLIAPTTADRPPAPMAEPSPEISPTVDHRDAMTVAEFRRRFTAGELQFERNDDFCVVDPRHTAGIDPHSDEYAAAVLQTWSALSGRPAYSATTNEAFELDQSYYLARPYPFCSSNPIEVSRYFGAVAATLPFLTAQPPARIVEFGAGWGHMSLFLASTGYEVTAVDLNGPSVELLSHRAEVLGVNLAVAHTSFLEFEPTETVNAIIFFESFHHCESPFELLDRCRRFLAPGGQMLFVAEPIYDDYFTPWGVRLDGAATFMTAQQGWLELGFDRAFFEGELHQRGFTTEWQIQPHHGPYGRFLIASLPTVSMPTVLMPTVLMPTVLMPTASEPRQLP
jgi:2-polyprenyl-3-methyl-5-hydroxy-6-metoxy-1,4-benzoquinol methylase